MSTELGMSNHDGSTEKTLSITSIEASAAKKSTIGGGYAVLKEEGSGGLQAGNAVWEKEEEDLSLSDDDN